MGIAGNTLDTIRTVFKRAQKLPIGPSYFDSLNYNSMSYSNVTLGPQNGYNDYLSDNVKMDQDLMSRYADYEGMDEFPEIGAAIDLYADDATVQDLLSNRSIWFESDNQEVEQILDSMLTDNLKIEEDLWEITRSLAKYGNEFNELYVMDGIGVIKMKHLPPPSVRRIEDMNGILYGFIHDPAMTFRMDTETFMGRLREKSSGALTPIPEGNLNDYMEVYEPWECVHFRLRSKARRDLYGYSVAEAARWAWKRLTMIEDAMVLYKITRSPQRYAYYVDVGDVPPQQAMSLVNKVKNDFKKAKYIDPNTGKPSFRFNPLCLDLETRIPLLSGKTKSLRALIADHERGVQNWTYTLDCKTKSIVPGKISWAGVTRRNAKVCRVTLDNCREEVVTPDHKFMLRDGSYCEAQNLKPGMSLMPFNRGLHCNTGYEYVVHPGEAGWDSIQNTHQMVASFFQKIENLDVHHKDFCKRNNHPENLQVLTKEEHSRLHGNFRGWNKTYAHSLQVIENNRKYNKGKNIIDYNNSQAHAEDNVLRRQVMKKWRAEQGERHNRKLRIKFTESLKDWFAQAVRENPSITIDALGELFLESGSQALREFQFANSRRIENMHRHLILKSLRHFGFANFRDFKNQVLHNHKVVSVEFLSESMDTGCITVDEFHNFALESGVFVKNSQDEDIFIPVRKGRRGTEIDVLSGPEGQQVEDAEYFLNKIYAALKTPKSYLGADETIGRANLSQMDVRFCRSVMRLQREVKNGMTQVGRVHLSAKNIDPDKIDYECHMVIPSGVFELAQTEVQQAKLELASQYKDANFSEYYVWSHVLGLSDEEINEIQQQRTKEQTNENNTLSADTAGKVGELMPKAVDNARDKLDKKAKEKTQRILAEISRGQTKFSKRMNELRSMVKEVTGAIRNQKHYNARR